MPYSDEETRNKAVVVDYYKKLICDWDFEAASAHLGDHFIQHNPTIPDGLDGLKTWIENVPDFVRENLKTDIKRVFADGDMVIVHSLNTMENIPAPPRAIADFFRLENGKVVEHWDVLQDVPAESLHNNPIA